MRQLVFLVTSNVSLSGPLIAELEAQGYAVQHWRTHEDLIRRLQSERPHLLLVDVTDTCTEASIRHSTARPGEPLPSAIPTIFFSANASETEIIAGLQSGADDYIAEPFSLRELVARVRAVLRRCERPSPQTIDLGSLKIDVKAMTLSVAGMRVTLTTAEYKLLEYLARNPWQPFSRRQLLHEVWPKDRSVKPRAVDTHIWRIRRKVESDPKKPVYLQTVHGMGYCLVIPYDTNSRGNLRPTWDSVPHR
jgi:DNA-binding response OmpR family regulator